MQLTLTELVAILGIVTQAGAFIWWASRLNVLVKLHDRDIHELQAGSASAKATPAGRELTARIEGLETIVEQLQQRLVS